MKNTLAILCLLFLSAATVADNFQISYRQGTSVSYIAYSPVRLFDGNNSQVFSGATDGLGRIIINYKTGTYRLEIDYRNNTYKKMVTIDQNRAFKPVSVSVADM